MKPLSLILSLVLGCAALQGSAQAEVVSPTKAASVYQFIPGARSNLYVINEYSTTPGHAFDSYIVFDLSTLGYTSGSQVTSASLQLYKNSALAAGFMAGFGAPVTGGEFLVTDANSIYEASPTWATRPLDGGIFSATEQFDFVDDGSGGYVDSWITVDVTALVQYWIDHPEENFGFRLSPAAVSPFGAAAFVGTDGGSLAPRLEVVPEPSTWALVVFGFGLFIFYRRLLARRRVGMNAA